MGRKIRKYTIPYELSGLAGLMVDYLSRWGEEMELLSVFLATLLIGLLIDAQGVLENTLIGLIFVIIVVLEFVMIVAVAFRKRELEVELWRAVHEIEKEYSPDDTPPAGGR